MRIAVLASGSGTILEAILRAGLPVTLVIADRPCRALELAAPGTPGTPATPGTPGTPAPTLHLIDRTPYGGFKPTFDRARYTRTLTELLLEHRIDLVAMAGFGTVLDTPIHEAFPRKIVNTHPSLLPKYPGWHAVADALADGARVTGCTVHIATLEMDAGPILAQAEVAVEPDDDEVSLHERIKAVERVLYPATISEALAHLADPAHEDLSNFNRRPTLDHRVPA